MTTVINIHKESFMFMTGVMSCLWQCHVSLMHTPSNKVLPSICIIYMVSNITIALQCVLTYPTCFFTSGTHKQMRLKN